MANLTLNTTSSIVDFLKSQNKPSDFTSRENLYKTSGLEARLGKYVGSSSQNTPDQIAQEALESPAFKLYQEKTGIQQLGLEGKAAEERQALQAKATALSKETEESFGKRGLFFSGMRPEAISAIAASLAASQLGVDRELAQKLLEDDVDTRKEFLDQVAQVAKDAQAGNKQALDILEKQGLTIGLDGQLTPTLAARSGMRAEESLRMSEERLRLSEEAGLRSERALQLSEERAARQATELSVSEKKAEDAIYLYGLPEASGQDALGAGVIPQDVLTDAIEKAAQ